MLGTGGEVDQGTWEEMEGKWKSQTLRDGREMLRGEA